MESQEGTRIRILLSLQRALLGEVFPDLRAVIACPSTAQGPESRVLVVFVVDGELTERDCESLGNIAAEVFADCDTMEQVKCETLRIDAPGPISMNGWWAYSRRECE